MKMKKLTAMAMAALTAATMIPSVPVMAADGGKVYYLNFKPEADEAWQNLAKAYTEETGTEVTVVTAASGQYALSALAPNISVIANPNAT